MPPRGGDGSGSGRDRFPRGRPLGPAGESAARAWLEARGLRAIASGVRTRFGELDLVLEEPATGTIVVVEVKARAGRGFGAGAEAVTRLKALRMGRAALDFLARSGLGERPLRFDVVAVESGPSGRAAILHYPDAVRFDE